MRVAIVSECFLPVVNGVTNSVRRIVEHLAACGHDVLIVAPGAGPPEHAGIPVVRLPAVELPVVTSMPVGVPGIRMVVVGAGPSEARLRTLLPEAAFLGFRDGDELARLYASLDIFVHTGPAETFCQAVQETLASGLPVVAPDTGGPRDLVLPGRTGYLVDDDTALRDAVRHLLDPALRAAFGATARRSVLRRTWSTVGDELVAHYTAVLTDHQERAA